MDDTEYAGVPRLIVVMGVSGVGKTVIGSRIADRLDLTYRDADDLHPPANVEKMSSGTPLTDEDRWPWLEKVGEWLAEHSEEGGVVGCSALKRSYRDVIREAAPATHFLHLDGEVDVIRERLSRRKDHYMPPSLLQSQLETLEPLDADEAGTVIDIAQTPDEIVKEFLS